MNSSEQEYPWWVAVVFVTCLILSEYFLYMFFFLRHMFDRVGFFYFIFKHLMNLESFDLWLDLSYFPNLFYFSVDSLLQICQKITRFCPKSHRK